MPNHPARPRRRLHQLLKFPLPPGERDDVTGQRPHRRSRPAWHHPAPGGRFELVADQTGQAQRTG